MKRNIAICFRKGPGKCVTISVAPCALKYIFTAFIIIFAKDDRLIAFLKTAVGW
jgi:hypothetical protein